MTGPPVLLVEVPLEPDEELAVSSSSSAVPLDDDLWLVVVSFVFWKSPYPTIALHAIRKPARRVGATTLRTPSF
jgi:hypothetical protein